MQTGWGSSAEYRLMGSLLAFWLLHFDLNRFIIFFKNHQLVRAQIEVFTFETNGKETKYNFYDVIQGDKASKEMSYFVSPVSSNFQIYIRK